MQGTVATFSSSTQAGTVLLDDGTELTFDRAAFERSGLRLLRSGQRVRFDSVGSGTGRRITMVTLVTF